MFLEEGSACVSGRPADPVGKIAMRVPVLILLAGIHVFGFVHGGDPRRYAHDLQGLIEHLDAKYPFFDVKGIRKEWKQKKKLWQRQIRRVRNDPQLIELIVEVMKSLRDGHCRFEELQVKMPNTPAQAYPGLSLLPATQGRVLPID